MQYVILYQGRVIWGPHEWNPLSIENAIGLLVGGDIAIGMDPVLGRLEQNNDFAILRVKEEVTPPHNEIFQALEGPYYYHNVNDGSTTIKWNVVPNHLPYAIGRIKSIVEGKRYQRENASIEINIGGNRYDFPTSREQRSQLAIQSVYGQPVSWKIGGVWVDMTHEQLVDVLSQINQHVQQCFEWERNTVASLEACTNIEQLQAIYKSIAEDQ